MVETRCAEQSNKRQLVVVDLRQQKPAWLAWCASVGLTPSEALRVLVARLEPGSVPTELKATAFVTGAVRPRPAAPLLRPKVSLTVKEWDQIDELAREEGVSVSRWIVSLVRAHLSGNPQLGTLEHQRLHESTSQVKKIGSNLNVMTHKLNELVLRLNKGGDPISVARGLMATAGSRQEHILSLIADLQSQINSHAAVVRTALQANIDRWTAKIGVRGDRQKSKSAAPT